VRRKTRRRVASTSRRSFEPEDEVEGRRVDYGVWHLRTFEPESVAREPLLERVEGMFRD
jgi:hypothetical protein